MDTLIGAISAALVLCGFLAVERVRLPARARRARRDSGDFAKSDSASSSEERAKEPGSPGGLVWGPAFDALARRRNSGEAMEAPRERE